MDELDDLLNAPDDPQAQPASDAEGQQAASDQAMDTEDDGDGDDGLAAPTQQSQQQGDPDGSHLGPSSPHADAAEAAEPEPDPAIDPEQVRRAQRNQQVIALMNERQLDRYAAFRRSKLNQKGLKRLVASATGKNMNGDAAIVLAGVSKMHVGEMVEKAREIAEKRGNYGPLLPQDVRAAFAEISRQKCTSSMHHRRRF